MAMSTVATAGHKLVVTMVSVNFEHHRQLTIFQVRQARHPSVRLLVRAKVQNLGSQVHMVQIYNCSHDSLLDDCFRQVPKER